jgi:hypothetical protein
VPTGSTGSKKRVSNKDHLKSKLVGLVLSDHGKKQGLVVQGGVEANSPLWTVSEKLGFRRFFSGTAEEPAARGAIAGSTGGARPRALSTACCQLPIQGACKRTGASCVCGRRGAAPRVFAARGQRIFEAAAGTRDTGARLPAGARALRDAREAPYQQPSRTPLHKVLRGPPDGESGTSAGSKKAAVHVCTPRGCGRAATWALAAQIPRHVCTCENVLWVGGRRPPFSCCVADPLC